MTDAISRSELMRSLEEAERRALHDGEWPYATSVLAKVNAINKELYRCNHHHSEYRKSKEVLYQLIKRYNEIYDTQMEMKSDAAD